MNTPVRQIREKRKDILLVLATAVLLALAINSATSYIAAIVPSQPYILLLLSAVFLLGAALLLYRIVFSETDRIIRLRGAIAFTEEQERIHPIEILGYSFSRHCCQYLRGLIQENKAYAKLFTKHDKTVVQLDRFNPDDLNRNTIINSVLEFIVLHELQLHLNTYFIENDIDQARIVTLSRDQLEPGVLRNRVIDQITKNMTERAAFAQYSDLPSGEVVFSSQGEGGAVYERLELELPPQSTIFRNRAGFLVVTNRLFDLEIITRYSGFVTYMHPVFMPSKKGPFAPMLAEIDLHIRIKKAAFVTGEAMEMYEWLDSFVNRMQDYVSTERLERRLDPDLIEILKS